MRCEGIEYFINRVLSSRTLPDLEFILNVGDYPQTHYSTPLLPIFSFSKDSFFRDIIYPAWAFWRGGPCTTTEKDCLGRWDLKRKGMPATSPPWKNKINVAFFRGSRTSHERDPLIKLGMKYPKLIEAKYTKNQAWRSNADSMDLEPQPEIRLEDHCKYKYLFNFRGVAASFRHRHLFLCKSVVLHVGEEWIEFYYPLMKPWVHYVPIKTDFSDAAKHLKFIMNNDDIAQRIATAGYDFIMTHLRMEDVAFYWYKLLRDYSKLITWKVERSSDTSPIRNERDEL